MMKRKPLISIEEQLYRAGIWERPHGVSIVPLWFQAGKYVIRYPDVVTGAPMLGIWDGERWGEPVNLT